MGTGLQSVQGQRQEKARKSLLEGYTTKSREDKLCALGSKSELGENVMKSNFQYISLIFSCS